MNVEVPGYRIGPSIEPPHPQCTVSDPVHAAEGPHGRVALKLLFLGFPLRDASIARYLEAMRAVQAIEHPAVVRVLDAGLAADGRPFYAMEYVDGETAAARPARGPTNSAEVSAIVARVAEGIAAAQRAGCAPDTDARHIMLAPTGARIWHVGVDRWREWARELVSGQYTAAGQYMRHGNLTPHGAKGLPPSPANACAQLALIAFQLLAGRLYWEADQDLGGSPMPMLMEVIANAGPPPSARSPHALPPGFDAWFARCLAGEVTDLQACARSFPA